VPTPLPTPVPTPPPTPTPVPKPKAPEGVVKHAIAVHQVKPEYPRIASREGIEGKVKALLNIDEDGTVVHVEIVEATPKRIFDEAVRKALMQSKYESFGKPYQAEVEVSFTKSDVK